MRQKRGPGQAGRDGRGASWKGAGVRSNLHSEGVGCEGQRERQWHSTFVQRDSFRWHGESGATW